MAGYLENLNEFLVGLFNEILKIEGNALCSGEAQEISVRDMHIIEAICAGKICGRGGQQPWPKGWV